MADFYIKELRCYRMLKLLDLVTLAGRFFSIYTREGYCVAWVGMWCFYCNLTCFFKALAMSKTNVAKYLSLTLLS
jgi:hypothetical protein